MTRVMKDKDGNMVIRGGSLLDAAEKALKDGEYTEEELEEMSKVMKEHNKQKKRERNGTWAMPKEIREQVGKKFYYGGSFLEAARKATEEGRYTEEEREEMGRLMKEYYQQKKWEREQEEE